MKTFDLPASTYARFSSDDLAFAGKAWRMKSEQEYVSAGVFAELTAALLDHGVSLAMAGAFESVVSDEIDHATLCDRLACELGNRQERGAREPIRTRLAGCRGDRRLEALSLLLIEGAIGETISTALFSASVEHAEEPRTKACLSRILEDETRHARVCWAASKELVGAISDEHRSRLQVELAAAFGSLERQNALPVLQRLDRGEVVDANLIALGIIQLEERVNVFYRTVEHSIMSKLNQLGFDPRRAWKDRFRHSTFHSLSRTASRARLSTP